MDLWDENLEARQAMEEAPGTAIEHLHNNLVCLLVPVIQL
jgi:hypothetical protein